MGGHMVLYRGSLKSCNYKCSYCPFSKHAMSQEELVKDRRQWNLFVSTYLKQAENLNLRALMLVPYGEALIHPWYWAGLAGISASAGTDAVGAQTNLGFSVKEALDDFRNAGGLTRKLRLWATFHPQMTEVSEFAEKCRVCMEEGVTVCAGAVGVPEHEGLLHQLREELPEEIYLWINKMDGLAVYAKREGKFCRHRSLFFPGTDRACGGCITVSGTDFFRRVRQAGVLQYKQHNSCRTGYICSAGWFFFL